MLLFIHSLSRVMSICGQTLYYHSLYCHLIGLVDIMIGLISLQDESYCFIFIFHFVTVSYSDSLEMESDNAEREIS